MLKQLLFPAKPDGTATSAMLLIARIVFGILLMNHGIQKWTNFQELSAVFPDPLGVGSPLSLGLAIFGELACSMAFIIGYQGPGTFQRYSHLAGRLRTFCRVPVFSRRNG